MSGKIEVSLQSDKNNGDIICRPLYVFNNISLGSSQNEKCFRKKLQRISKHICSMTPFPENHAVCEIKRKNMLLIVRQGTDVKRTGRMRIALWITKSTDTQLRICNNYCSPTSTVVTRTPLIVTFRTFPVSFVLQPATRIPLQPNHTESPTHIETRTIRPNVEIQQNSYKLLMMGLLTFRRLMSTIVDVPHR